MIAFINKMRGTAQNASQQRDTHNKTADKEQGEDSP